jgi:hypothetical protein
MTDQKNKQRSQYFQTIARHFFRHRGVPFYLSSKDLDLIARWEKMGIPLGTVLEGISRSFESCGPGKRKKSKIFSLSYCHPHIIKAFQLYRERRVGSSRGKSEREKKRERARAEVKMFLKKLPTPVRFLKEVYSQAYEFLSRSHVEEGKLELLDEEVERLLLENCPLEESEEDEKGGLKAEGGRMEKLLDIHKLQWVKCLRENHKIPYISLFYY